MTTGTFRSRSAIAVQRLMSASPSISSVISQPPFKSISSIDRTPRGTPSNTKWDQLIGSTLIRWIENPMLVADEGIDAPAPHILQEAINLAKGWSEDGDTWPPDSIVPDSNGGIVFERKEGDTSEVMHVWSDGLIEYIRFDKTRIVERRPL